MPESCLGQSVNREFSKWPNYLKDEASSVGNKQNWSQHRSLQNDIQQKIVDDRLDPQQSAAESLDQNSVQHWPASSTACCKATYICKWVRCFLVATWLRWRRNPAEYAPLRSAILCVALPPNVPTATPLTIGCSGGGPRLQSLAAYKMVQGYESTLPSRK